MSLAECSSLHNKRRFLSDGNGGNNAKNEVGMRPSVLSAKKEFWKQRIRFERQRGEDENGQKQMISVLSYVGLSMQLSLE